MSDGFSPATGTCRCGRVELEITKPPLLTMACHCAGCQKMSASAFSLSAVVPSDGFRVTRGDPVIGGLHGESGQYFCPYCMSWLFTRPQGLDFIVNVRSTMFEQQDWKKPFIETCTSEKLDWATTPARHSFPIFPPQDAWSGLIAEFASRIAK